MPEIKIRIKNLPEIRAAFSKAPRLMTRRLNEAIKQSIFTIQRESMIHTPVDTGRLRASHYPKFRSLYGEVGPTAFYAPFVHEGTRFIKGRPFLRNAAKTEEQRVQGFFTQAVKKVLNEIGRST